MTNPRSRDSNIRLRLVHFCLCYCGRRYAWMNSADLLMPFFESILHFQAFNHDSALCLFTFFDFTSRIQGLATAGWIWIRAVQSNWYPFSLVGGEEWLVVVLGVWWKGAGRPGSKCGVGNELLGTKGWEEEGNKQWMRKCSYDERERLIQRLRRQGKKGSFRFPFMGWDLRAQIKQCSSALGTSKRPVFLDWLTNLCVERLGGKGRKYLLTYSVL